MKSRFRFLYFFIQTALFTVPVFSNASESEQGDAPPVLSIPTELGTVTMHGSSDAPLTVIHIQDAHCYYPVQKQITNIISYLKQAYSIDTIFVEGAETAINAQRIATFPDETIREKTADYFLKEGKISGVEYLAISDNNRFSAEGIEDGTVYRSNYAAFSESRGISAAVDSIAAQFSSFFSRLKSDAYSDELLELDRHEHAFHNGQEPLRPYIQYLNRIAGQSRINLNSYKNIAVLLALLQKEQALDYRIIELEKNTLISRLQEKLTDEQKITLLDATLNFSLQKITSLSLFRLLKDFSETSNIPLEEFAQLNRYIGYLEESESVSFAETYKELDQATEHIRSTLTATDSERQIHRLDSFVRRLSAVAALQASRTELETYHADREWFSSVMTDYLRRYPHFAPSFERLEQLYEQMERIEQFYIYAFQRDSILAANTVRAMQTGKLDRAILVTGGFHADGIAKNLQDMSVQVVSVRPAFLSSPEITKQAYESIILGYKNPLENYLLMHGQTLAAALALVEGSPLVQEWKGEVYRREFEIMALVAKLSALRAEAEQELGITAAQKLTDSIAAHITALIQSSADSFLAAWDTAYSKQTGITHPFRNSVDVSISFAGNDFFAVLEINGQPIHFPLNPSFAVNPGAIVNAYLTPERYTALLAGDPAVKEIITSVDELKTFRHNLREFFLSPHSVSGHLQERDRTLAYSIIRSLAATAPLPVKNALSDIDTNHAFQAISDTVNQALFDARLDSIIGILAEKIGYADLYEQIQFGAATPLRVLHSTLNDEEPDIALFSGYLADAFTAFNGIKELEDILLIVNSLHDQYIASGENAGAPLDTRMLARIAKIIHASLSYGDGIRPHRVVGILAYGFSPWEDVPFMRYWQMHNLIEQQSLYDENEVIRLLFYTRWANPSMIRPLISLNLPYTDLLNILDSPEIEALRRSPSPRTFAAFKRATAPSLTPQAQIAIFAGALPQYDPVRIALTTLAAAGFTDSGTMNDRFMHTVLRIKRRARFSPGHAASYDLVIMHLLNSIPDEFLQPQDMYEYIGVFDFETLDKNSSRFSDTAITHFQNASSTQRIQKATVISAHPGYPSASGSVQTELGIEITTPRYRQALARFLEEQERPTLLLVDHTHHDEMQRWLDELNLNSMVVLIRYDSNSGDLVIDAKKDISWLDYWPNLTSMLARNFRNIRLNVTALDKQAYRRLDSISREEISPDSFFSRYGELTYEETLQLAGSGGADILSNLIQTGTLDETILNAMIQNTHFNPNHINAILHNSSIPVTDSFYAGIAELTHPQSPAVQPKFGRFDFKTMFAGIQNNRTGRLLAALSEQPSTANTIFNEIEDAAQLAALAAHGYRNGFQFTQDFTTAQLSLRMAKWDAFAHRLMALAPEAAADFAAALLPANTADAQRIIESLASARGAETESTVFLVSLLRHISRNNPEFQDLIPFVQSDISPSWHKGFIISQLLQPGTEPSFRSHYIYTILNIFSGQSEFTAWIQSNAEKHQDRVDEWIRVVSLLPEIDELRSEFMLTAAIMTDMHIVLQYREFLTMVTNPHGHYTALRENPEEFRLLFRALNADFALPIESKMFVFNILPFIKLFLPDGTSVADIFNDYVEKADAEGTVTRPGIPVYALLPVLVFAEGNLEVLDSFKTFFSVPQISAQRSVKVQLASYFLRIFSQIDHGGIRTLLSPSGDQTALFREFLFLSTSDTRRAELMKLFSVKQKETERLADRFQSASRHREIILKSIGYAGKEGFNRRNQRALIESINFLSILNDNFSMLSAGETGLGERFTALLNSADQFDLPVSLHKAVMEVFVSFIQLDFPDVFESEKDIIEKLPRIEQVTNFWIYKADWETENPRGLQLLRDAVRAYLKDGSSLKWLKYGGTPESARQLEVYTAVLTDMWTAHFMEREGLAQPQALQKAALRSAQFAAAWKRDSSEHIDLSIYPQLDSDAQIVTWTSDEVPHWLNFGMAGGCTCFAPGNVVSYTKNLPGFIFSGLVAGGLYIGKYQGDIREQVDHALLPVIENGKPRMYLVNQFYYSSGGEGADLFGAASVIASIRNAALYGTAGVIIPNGSPQSGYFRSHAAFFLKDFSTIVEHRDATGKIIARERISLDSAESVHSLPLTVPREPNQWRYFDEASMYKGEYYEKMNRNFSFVDFSGSVPLETAGVSFEGLTVEVDSLVIKIRRQPLPLNPEPSTAEPAQLSDKLQEMAGNKQLTIVQAVNPQIEQLIGRIALADTTTGENLNIVLQASQIIAENLRETILLPNRPENKIFLLLTFTRTGVPIARKIGEMMEGSVLDFSLAYLSSDNELRNFPTLERSEIARPIFIIDEAIVTGTTSARNIDLVIEKGVTPDQIVIVTLTADPRALERLSRKYPGIRFIVGTLEERAQQQGEYVSIALSNLIQKTQPLTLTRQERVKVGGVEYRILDRIQRGKSFVVFHAETEEGRKVVLKTTVSANEGERFRNISALIPNASQPLGIPQFHHYDAQTGILVTDFIDGATLGDYLRSADSDITDLSIDLMYALRDMMDVAQFLSDNELLFVNLNLNNIRLDTASGRWHLTNYSPFPYRLQPLEEEGVLLQVSYILQESIRIMQTRGRLLFEQDRKAIQSLQSMHDDISAGRIATIHQLQARLFEGRTALFYPQKAIQPLALQDAQTERLKVLLQIPEGNLIAEQLYALISSRAYSGAAVRGLVSLALQNTSLNDAELASYLLNQLESDLQKLTASIPSASNLHFSYSADEESLISQLWNPEPLTPEDTGMLLTRTGALVQRLSEQASTLIKTVRSGKPVLLAGNNELVRWIVNELYSRLGESYRTMIFIVPAVSDYSHLPETPDDYRSQPLVPLDEYTFARTIRHGKANIIGYEAAILDWNEIAKERELNAFEADTLRRRIVKNPHLNFMIKNLRGSVLGFMSFTLQRNITPNLLQAIPESDDTGRRLVLYSSFLDVPRLREQYRTAYKELLLAIIEHMNYPRVYRAIQSGEFFSYVVNRRYLPYLNTQENIEPILAAVRRNESAELIRLFPFHTSSIEAALSTALESVWKQNGQRLSEILAVQGSQAFLSELIRSTLRILIDSIRQTDSGAALSGIIRDMLGIPVSPYEFLVFSLKNPDGQMETIDRLYEEYRTYMNRIQPGKEPLSRNAFLKITAAENGTLAFQEWISYHNPELQGQYVRLITGDISPLSDSITEQIGNAFTSFLLFTNRQLLDSALKDFIFEENTTPVISTPNIMPDILSSANPLDSLQSGFIASVQYRTHEEQLHWFDWLDQAVQSKLRDFLVRISDSDRKLIEDTLLQTDYLTYIPQIERALEAVFNSSLSDQSIITLIRSGLDTLGTALESVEPDGTVILVDASEESTPIIQSFNAYILFGDYPQVRKKYTEIIAGLPIPQTSSSEQFAHSVLGYTHLIPQIPPGIPNELRTPLIHFAQIDEARIRQAHAATLFSRGQQPSAFHTGGLTDSGLNEIILTQLGQGGAAVQLATAIGEKIDTLSRLDISYEYTTQQGNMYIRLKLAFGDKEYDFPARLEITDLEKIPFGTLTLPQHDVTLDGFEQAIMPFARRLAFISSSHLLITTFFEPVNASADFQGIALTGLTAEQYDDIHATSLRRKTAALTRLWHTNRYAPLAIDGTFMSIPSPEGETLKVIFDSTVFEHISTPEQLLISLAQQRITIFTVAPEHRENWENGIQVPVEPAVSAIDGILDGFNGNPVLLNNLRERLGAPATKSYLIHTIIQRASALFSSSLSRSELSEINRILYLLSAKAPADARRFDFSALRQLPFLENFSRHVTELENAANQLLRTLIDSQTAIQLYNQGFLENYLAGSIGDRVRQFESYLFTNETAGQLERFIFSQTLINNLQSNQFLSPSQLIEARVLLSLIDVQPSLRRERSVRDNKNRNDALRTTLKEIRSLLHTEPESIPNRLDEIIEQSGYTEDAFLGLILPGFDASTRTFEIHGQRLRLTSLSALLRTERILAARPLLVAGDSSTLNFEVFERIKSLFNLPVISYESLAHSPQEREFMGLGAQHDSQHALTTREYVLTRWTSEQAGSYFIDLAQPFSAEFAAQRREGTFFDVRSIETTEAFLDEFVLHFESSFAGRLTFYFDDALLAPILKEEEFDESTRTDLTEFLRTVVQTRIELAKAAHGTQSDVLAFMAYAQSAGLAIPPEEMIARVRLMDSGAEIAALIVDSLRGSNRYPAFADVYERMVQRGGVSDSRLIMMMDVYSRLAQEYFARYIEGLAKSGDVAIDTDLGIIEHAGKETALSGDSFSFILQLLKSARIGYKVFSQGTTAETVIAFSRQLSGESAAFADTIARRTAQFPDLIPELNQRSERFKIRFQRQQVIEQSL